MNQQNVLLKVPFSSLIHCLENLDASQKQELMKALTHPLEGEQKPLKEHRPAAGTAYDLPDGMTAEGTLDRNN